MPERCTWCDKFPLLQVEVALVEADETHYVCEECWPEEEWGEWPHDKRRREYALQQLTDVQKAACQVGQRVHLWPDKDLVENAFTEEQREWCRQWRSRASPENIGDGMNCTDPYPDLPEVSRTVQTKLN